MSELMSEDSSLRRDILELRAKIQNAILNWPFSSDAKKTMSELCETLWREAVMADPREDDVFIKPHPNIPGVCLICRIQGVRRIDLE